MTKQTGLAIIAAVFVTLLSTYAYSAERSFTGGQALLPFDVPMDRHAANGLSTPRYILSENQRTHQAFAVLSSYALIDYTQSVAMFYRSSGYYELNPVLGKKPSRRSMALFGLIGIAAVYAIASTLPDDWKRIFVDSVVASEQMNIEDNRLVHEGWNAGGPPVRGRSFNGVPIVISFRF